MSTIRIKSENKVTLLGAGPFNDTLLDFALARAPTLMAADGGADHALNANLRPEAIIGDLDSLTTAEVWRNSDSEIIEIPEQDSTDFDKCMRVIDAPLLLGVGFVGGRLDHQLAAFSALMAFRDKPVIILSEAEICFHCPAKLQLEAEPGTPVSIYPLAPIRGTSSIGLRWSVDGLLLEPGGRLGTSNQAVGGQVKLSFDGPGGLMILPISMLDRVIDAISSRVD